MSRSAHGLFVLALIVALFGWSLQAPAQVKKKKTPTPTAQDSPQHDPANAVKNLDVHPELQATLFASELDGITNPVNLDIDHRGRVWVCDVMNYRGNNGRRPAGDRILILEDTDGDGKCDKVKTFHQGRDVDSAMGICVLGNRVIVSATPNIFVFHFDDNDKITKREVLFSKSGQPQHDHSLHSFVFGPDGRLYWNFGNTGRSVHDKDGKQIIDLAGNAVNDSGKPYRQGMIFRMDTPWLKNNSWPDAAKGPGAGVNFETLAWNFRNNYEVCVDSFGSMWQSDNDDDGNRGVRINFVMEYGNYGYVDEMTGAGWQAKRTNMEKDLPEKHWHLNDPGVVPNLLHTGAGSPTGITVYEGTLLPKVFQGQMIHCDAGPSIVRAYPVTKDGAGYKATIVNMLDGAKKNNWFRPADVCTAPDGSLFVTDWYDPGVGGHAQRDLDRGRIFRIAPKSFSPGSQNRDEQKGTGYKIPKHDFSTADGAVEALKNPNLATRYLAWTALHDMGAKAEPALEKAWQSKDARFSARALWLLGQLPGKGSVYAKRAIVEEEEEYQKIVGVRLARQLRKDTTALIMSAIPNSSLAVWRECAIGLREQPPEMAASLWATFAAVFDTKDRWMLEALGSAADKDWDTFLEQVYGEVISVHRVMEPLTHKPYRELVWRSRGKKTPALLAEIIQAKTTNADDLPRFLRAFDFQKDSPIKQAALVKLAFGEQPDAARQSFVTAEALARIKSLDLKANPEHAAAVNKLLDRSRGTSTFIEMVGKFNVADRYPELLAIAQKHPGEQLGVDAMRVLLERNCDEPQIGLDSKDNAIAIATVQAIGNAAHTAGVQLLSRIVTEPMRDLELRRQATRALGRTKPGAELLIKLAKGKKLGKGLEIAASAALHSAPWKEVKQQAVELFPVPAGKDNVALPAVSDLAKRNGNANNGKLVFAKVGTCVNCHIVNGEGKQVGPDLSEIGKKLSKEALYESILYPSAGISHNFETWIAETSKGDIVQGVLISQTPQEVVLKDKDALLRTFKRSDLESLVKSPISLMPADLHKNLTTQEMVDVVEYLLTLREARKK